MWRFPNIRAATRNFDIVINDKADSWAKKANKEHIVPEHIAGAYRQGYGRAKHISFEVAQLLAQHPKPKAEGCQYVREKETAAVESQSSW